MRYRNDEVQLDGFVFKINLGKSRQHNYKFDDIYAYG